MSQSTQRTTARRDSVSALAVPLSRAGRVVAGRWVLVVTGALLVGDGLWLATSASDAQVLAQDSGLTVAAVLAAERGLVEEANARGTQLGLLLTGFGAMVLLLAWDRRVRTSWTARGALIVATGTLAGQSAAAFAGGNGPVGSVHAGFATLLALGLVLSSPSRRP